MDADLNVSPALAVLHGARRAGNAALAGSDKPAVAEALGAVLAMTEVLGLNPLRWQGNAGQALTETVGRLVELALQQRQAARDRKDYQASDAIREALVAAGVQVEDTPNGTRWTLAR
jgi:cysteinyl-tRNA synthetase